jgi:hypothetical protein
MKLLNIFEASGNIDWNKKTEKQQINMVKKNGLNVYKILSPTESVQLAAVEAYSGAIQYIDNPSEAVQLAAIELNPHNIVNIKKPTPAAIKAALTSPLLINLPRFFEDAVRRTFKNNQLLMNKWLRYGEVMRRN